MLAKRSIGLMVKHMKAEVIAAENKIMLVFLTCAVNVISDLRIMMLLGKNVFMIMIENLL